MIILNLGGEGEDPEAIDLNTLVSPRRPIVAIRRPGWLIEADFLVLPIRTDSIDEVRGNMVPLRLDRGHGECWPLNRFASSGQVAGFVSVQPSPRK